VAEAISRFVRRDGDDNVRVRIPDSFLHHAFRPYASGRLVWGAQHVQYDINSAGFRDRFPREVSPTTSADRRILLLGDSFVEGLGVPYALTVSHHIEEIMNGSGLESEVLNGAVASYSPFLYYRALRRFFERGYSTNDVIVFLDVSDVQDEATAGYEHLGENEAFRSESWQSVMEVLRRSQVVQQFWETIVFTSPTQRDNYYKVRDRWTEDDALFEQYGLTGVERCRQLLLRIRDLAVRHNARLVLVIYPWPTQLASSRIPSRVETLFSDFAIRNGIPFVNTFPAFRSLPDWRSYYQADDAHWNADGHRFVARLVADHLLADAGKGSASTSDLARPHRERQ
jgi:hypothetical protein